MVGWWVGWLVGWLVGGLVVGWWLGFVTAQHGLGWLVGGCSLACVLACTEEMERVVLTAWLVASGARPRTPEIKP